METKQHKTNIRTGGPSPELNLREQIEKRAYEIWGAGGSRHGEDISNWLKAEREVLEEAQAQDEPA